MSRLELRECGWAPRGLKHLGDCVSLTPKLRPQGALPCPPSGQAPGHTCLSPPPPAAGGNASPRPRAKGSSLLTEISPYAKWFAQAQGWTLFLCMEADMEPSLTQREERSRVGGALRL